RSWICGARVPLDITEFAKPPEECTVACAVSCFAQIARRRRGVHHRKTVDLRFLLRPDVPGCRKNHKPENELAPPHASPSQPVRREPSCAKAILSSRCRPGVRNVTLAGKCEEVRPSFSQFA